MATRQVYLQPSVHPLHCCQPTIHPSVYISIHPSVHRFIRLISYFGWFSDAIVDWTGLHCSNLRLLLVQCPSNRLRQDKPNCDKTMDVYMTVISYKVTRTGHWLQTNTHTLTDWFIHSPTRQGCAQRGYHRWMHLSSRNEWRHRRKTTNK